MDTDLERMAKLITAAATLTKRYRSWYTRLSENDPVRREWEELDRLCQAREPNVAQPAKFEEVD